MCPAAVQAHGDSTGATSHLQGHIDRAALTHPPYARPDMQVPNGDMVRILKAAVDQRIPGSIDAQWTKGHADCDSVQQMEALCSSNSRADSNTDGYNQEFKRQQASTFDPATQFFTTDDELRGG